MEEPVRFRDRGVDWDEFERTVQVRVDRIQWGASAAKVAGSFTDVIIRSARECLGVIRPRSFYGYEWWNEELNRMRGETAKKRKVWQRTKARGGDREPEARLVYLRARAAYRRRMRETQTVYFKQIAESGNVDPWGIAYRAASGRCRAPRNVVNGLALSEGFATDTAGAMSGMFRALCPDDCPAGDSGYYRLVRVAATLVPSGKDAGPVSSLGLGKIVGSLPNTAPGLDGISSRIVKHVWKAVQQEFCEVFDRCVKDGVFPGVWKSGRLLVIPKGNGRPVSDPKAYRPITLLPVLGKILEKILLELAPGLRDGISENQHGFIPRRSTSTALNDILGVSRGSATKYVQLIFLDISGAFDNAWWPMVLTKVKRGGFPPNLYRLLTDYFTDRRVGFLVGTEVVWKRSTMGCPQGSVLGPALWNVLLDDLLRLPFPAGVKTVAYADDVTVLVEASSRAEIERRSAQALDLMQDWGRRNRLAFAPAKSCTMTVKGRLQRPPIVRMGGDSIRTVSAATVLGLVLDEHLSFAQHAQSIGERASKSFGKVSRVSAASWGMRFSSLKTIYSATYLTTLTYVAGCWYERANLHVVHSTLLKTQRPALTLLTKAYRTVSTAALPVLAGVLPAHMEVVVAGKTDREREGRTAAEVRVLRRRVRDEMIALWQRDWDEEKNGRELYRYFPDVSARLSFGWVEPDYQTSQLLTGHGCFRKRLYELGLNETSECLCGQTDEDMHHVLWSCPLYDDLRSDMLSGIKVLQVGPVYYADLVGTQANFRRFVEYARAWHGLRGGLK
ncbi:Retrovirus-related Pol polyprotein from type-1 retrotransposable element R1 [Eumeta japonica]|uniref:Retrovirus-related Pol polyprotein from type-1 retrotransposable element R1 n=1 Tax=Eumeta variegata TaxID=151549 RepID=A0A4C1XLK8_EUMVA|nr:Retrovirus-related Pol polyprotein from type-1 retrotransposable element R1 [Eumeta japonica]